jgi:hypothetical protein
LIQINSSRRLCAVSERDTLDELTSRHIAFWIVGAHAQLRDLLRAEGLAEKADSAQWLRSLDSVLGEHTAN